MTSDAITCANFISTATGFVEDCGIILETGSDFADLEGHLKNQSERAAFTRKFDSRDLELNEKTGFWIIGRDINGDLVHTQAVRLLDLKGKSLADCVSSRFDEFTPDGWQIDHESSNFQPAPGSKSISGTVCYHGEFWLKGGMNGFRGAGVTVLVARIAMAVSLMKWSPDFIFAFMHSHTICKGLAAKAGFMHTEQNNLFWKLPNHPESVEAWTAWVSRADIRHLLEIPPHVLSKQLSGVKRVKEKKKVA